MKEVNLSLKEAFSCALLNKNQSKTETNNQSLSYAHVIEPREGMTGENTTNIIFQSKFRPWV